MNELQHNAPASGALVEIEQQRAIAEVQAAVMLARRFPRDQADSYARIIQACKRKSLAEVSQYSYSRGGTLINGASIRLAEMLAQNWGNIEFGIRELEQRSGVTVMEAYAWDLETNTRERRVFHVKHIRDTKKGSYAIDDARDIYELAANLGKRRQRACIFAVIPGDVIDAAVAQCNTTLEGDNETSISDIARDMLVRFGELGVTKEMIEKRIQHSLEAVTRLELVALRKVYNSIKDGFGEPSQFFELPEPKAPPESSASSIVDRLAALGKRPLKKAKEETVSEKDAATSSSAGEAQRPTLRDAQAAIIRKEYDLALDFARYLPTLESTAIREEVEIAMREQSEKK